MRQNKNINFALFIARGKKFYKKRLDKMYPDSDQLIIPYMYGADIYSYKRIKKTSLGKLRKDISKYDFIILTMDISYLEEMIKIIKARPKFIFGYSDNCLDTYQLYNPSQQALFFKVLGSVNAHLVYWENGIDFFSSLSKKPVYYLPFPYSKEYTKEIKQGEKENSIVISDGFSSQTRNGITGLIVARQLIEDEIYDKAIVYIHRNDWFVNINLMEYWFNNKLNSLSFNELAKTNRLMKKDKFYKIFKMHMKSKVHVISDKLTLYIRGNYNKYLKTLAKSSLLIELNNRYSIGRNAWDCALLKIPYISTACTDMSGKFYPYTCVKTPWDIKTAYNLGKKLKRDKKFHTKVTDYALKNLEIFLPDSFQKKFESILKEFNLINK